ncbi:MAG: hypothetical protein LBH06_09225 [Rikenellaceae bacterium]|nr:hypothetical protein [Rikenellaceae bacterium]
MKRAFAISLLAVMLCATSHMALALHYCGGDLRSVAPVGLERKSCCSTHSHEDEEGLQKGRCCSEVYMQIATDDFSATARQAATDNAPHQTFILCPSPALARTDLLTVKNLFPPGSPVRSGKELLTFIHILRI